MKISHKRKKILKKKKKKKCKLQFSKSIGRLEPGSHPHTVTTNTAILYRRWGTYEEVVVINTRNPINYKI
jgi:hypothetical protein